ncbi:L-threonylcarbamoyladenylate synthase [Sediminibacterium sp.]|uniref:L-threonylcarbamoyladenylate synthase n=1 Tax=Sediminibacterium sp. TaxID=1917865 RepID=UPI0025E0BB1E|nr:L-threonylcarbamoyladenylate synthase [Sediminibacterium sp.]MBW0176906.1 threonylcarbamoyl-AMP synthase [Sediminibacterium sp.]
MSLITTDIKLVADSLSKEEVAAIPTETVYGLAGNIYSEKAIRSIFRIKQRPLFNPLIVHLPNADALRDVAKEIPAMAKALADKFWPGPLTLLLPKKDTVPDLITAGKPTVAVRVPNHALTLSLLEQLSFPLAAPSANPFGSISPTTAEHVANYFKDAFPYILDGGPCSSGIESTIIGFNEDGAIVYRYGSLAIEDIEEITGPVQEYIRDEETPDAPGMLLRHYAPSTSTILSNDIDKTVSEHVGKKIGLMLFSHSSKADHIVTQEILSASGSLEEAASNLYAAMHRLDQQQLDIIITERFPDKGLGRSINDRLQRATHA